MTVEINWPNTPTQSAEVAAKHNTWRLTHRGKVVAALGGIAAAVSTIPVYLGITAATSPGQNVDRVIEQPVGEQNFKFKLGQGENDAIVNIKGAGVGEGDPGWNVAKGIVEAQLGHNSEGSINLPQPGQTIIEPAEIRPVHIPQNKK